MKTKVAIIGGGPASIATAIQLKRYKIDPLLFEQKELGGLLKNAYKVENYLGFPKGISGLKLVKLFKKHLKAYNVKVIFEKVILLDYKENYFLIRTSKNEYFSEIAVIASGTKPKTLNIIENREELKNKIFYEIYPILNIKNKHIVVIGAGDAAFDYALSLSKNNKILILNRGKRIKALPLLVERAMNNPSIKYCENSFIKKINKKGEKILIDFIKNGEITSIEVDYIVVAIGRVPQKDFYSLNLIKMEEELLSKGLLYLVGDVKNDIYRQTAIAIGDGIYTAMKIYWSRYESHR
ncbi:MAG: NAD(P)/FAD-dependent oxidoreductase [Candidatus Desulfofervidus auxilii]|nr:NAD(P)/FAD-dependent oxidoreductase [Candidatus Desulfofervidus auxilii]